MMKKFDYKYLLMSIICCFVQSLFLALMCYLDMPTFESYFSDVVFILFLIIYIFSPFVMFSVCYPKFKVIASPKWYLMMITVISVSLVFFFMDMEILMSILAYGNRYNINIYVYSLILYSMIPLNIINTVIAIVKKNKQYKQEQLADRQS